MLAAVIAWRRQKPYTHREFVAAMDRICDGAQELWTVLDDEARFAAFAVRDRKAVRARCRRLLQDILKNACYVLDRAEPCSRRDRRRELERVEINRCAADVVRQSLAVIFYVRSIQLRLVFDRDALQSCRHTLKATRKYTGLWMAVVALLEAKLPTFKEELSHAG